VGFHSNRRVPYPDALAKVKPLYAQLLATEKRAANPNIGMEASYASLVELLQKQNVDYSEFVFSLSDQTRLEAAAH